MANDQGDMNGSQAVTNGIADDTIVFKANSLHGATEWKFPPTNNCPMLSCLREFADRETNINHYRDVHLRTMTYCKTCDRPIGSKKFGNHLMSKRHKSMENYTAEDINLVDEYSTLSENGSDHCTSSDTFSLFIVGKPKKISWRFPQITSCPLYGCRLRCESRDIAVEHFRQAHADGCVFCANCESPLSAKLKTNVPLHYAKRHPSLTLDPDWLKYLPKSLNKHRHKVSQPSHESPSNDSQFENAEPSTSSRSKWAATAPYNDASMEIDSEIPVMIKTTKTVSYDTKEFKGNIVEEKFQCVTCAKSFNQEDDMLNHLNMQHSSVHVCFMCAPKQFMTHVSARAHYLDYHQVFADKCPMCTDIFWDTETFKQHIITHMEIKETPVDTKHNVSGGSIEVVYLETRNEDEQNDDILAKQRVVEVPKVGSDNDSGHSSDAHEQQIGEIPDALKREDENREADKNEIDKQEEKKREFARQQTEKGAMEVREVEKRAAEKRKAVTGEVEEREAEKRAAAEKREAGKLENGEVEKQKVKKRSIDYDYFMYKKRMRARETVYKPTARKSTAKPAKPLFPRLNLLSSEYRSMPRIESSDSDESVVKYDVQMRNKKIASTANGERDKARNYKEDEKQAVKEEMVTAHYDEDSNDDVKYCDPELQNLVDELLGTPTK